MKKTLNITIIAVLISLSLLINAKADEFEIIPSVLVREEYNSNIFFTKDDKTDDYITTLAGSLEMVERTERLDANLYGRVAPFWYADNSDLDDTDWLVRGRGDYLFSPRFKAGVGGGYLVDHRPDRDVDVTGVTLGDRRRKRWDGSLDADYSFNEITAARLNYAYRDENWSDGNFDDLKAHDVLLGFTRNLSGGWENTIARVNIGYAYYNYETSDTDLFYGSLGVEHRFTEKFSALLDLGPRYSHSDFKTLQLQQVAPGVFQQVVVNDSNNKWGGVGNLELNYRAERTFSRLTASSGLYPTSGRTGPTERTAARFNVSHLLTEKLRVSLPLGWIRNRADSDQFSAQDSDQDTAYVAPFLRWELYDGFTLEGRYNFTYVWDQDDDGNRYQHRVFLQLAYGLPLFDFFRDFDPVSGGRPGFRFDQFRYGR